MLCLSDLLMYFNSFVIGYIIEDIKEKKYAFKNIYHVQWSENVSFDCNRKLTK